MTHYHKTQIDSFDIISVMFTGVRRCKQCHPRDNVTSFLFRPKTDHHTVRKVLI